MEQTKKESQLERYWRLRGEADELYQRRMREMHQKMSVELRGFVEKELDALEKAIESRPHRCFAPQTDIGSPAGITVLITHAS